MKLEEFLVNAKKNTYAKNGENKEIILDDGGKRFIYEEENFRYQDTYHGFNPFSGRELVWKDKRLVFSMTYVGLVLTNLLKDRTEKDVYQFLKKALLNVKENYPFRGPKTFTGGKLRYQLEYQGDLKEFTGKEKILDLVNNKCIYELEFRGKSYDP